MLPSYLHLRTIQVEEVAREAATASAHTTSHAEEVPTPPSPDQQESSSAAEAISAALSKAKAAFTSRKRAAYPRSLTAPAGSSTLRSKRRRRSLIEGNESDSDGRGSVESGSPVPLRHAQENSISKLHPVFAKKARVARTILPAAVAAVWDTAREAGELNEKIKIQEVSCIAPGYGVRGSREYPHAREGVNPRELARICHVLVVIES